MQESGFRPMVDFSRNLFTGSAEDNPRHPVFDPIPPSCNGCANWRYPHISQ